MRRTSKAVYDGIRNSACNGITFSVMSRFMMTVDQIVDGCNGTSAVASALDLTPSTVSSWREVNFIPRWWHAPVLKVAKRAKFAMTEDDFPPKSARKPRSPAPQAERAA